MRVSTTIAFDRDVSSATTTLTEPIPPGLPVTLDEVLAAASEPAVAAVLDRLRSEPATDVADVAEAAEEPSPAAQDADGTGTGTDADSDSGSIRWPMVLLAAGVSLLAIVGGSFWWFAKRRAGTSPTAIDTTGALRAAEAEPPPAAPARSLGEMVAASERGREMLVGELVQESVKAGQPIVDGRVRPTPHAFEEFLAAHGGKNFPIPENEMTRFQAFFRLQFTSLNSEDYDQMMVLFAPDGTAFFEIAVDTLEMHLSPEANAMLGEDDGHRPATTVEPPVGMEAEPAAPPVEAGEVMMGSVTDESTNL